MNNECREAGRRYVEAGLNIIPVNSRKKPAIETWKEYQNGTRSTLEDIENWAKLPWVYGWAAVCGEPSSGLIVLDFDVEGIYERWCEKVGPVSKAIPAQQTGSGTYQTWFRCNLPLRNDILAYIPADNKEGREVAIETRVNGGYAVAAPSFCPQATKRGKKHKQPYRIIQGDFTNIPILSEEDVERLFDAARELDECPVTKKQMQSAPLYGADIAPERIREAFNQAHRIHTILERNGYERAGKRYLAPDSTTGNPGVFIFEDSGRCYSHHANDPLNDGHSHDPFSAFCILEHGDDFKAAANAAEKTLGIKFEPKSKQKKPHPRSLTIIPEIIITKRFLHDKTNEAIEALETANHPSFLFRRSGTLARISLDEKENPRIETINDNQLRGILARCAHFLKETDKGMVATDPPMDLVKDILALGKWSFPALEGIIQAPAMRPDGTVLNQPGYDPQTRLYYITPSDLLVPGIPENPSQDALKKPLENLLEIICDFPFVEDADRANALGLIMTLPLRPAIPGNIPMAAITAPTPGTGKGLLSEIVALLGTGKVAAMAGFPRDDDEMRKFITSRLLAGDPLIVFDNLELPLWGPSLSRALTCTEWEDRILSKNLTVRLPQRAVWIATGNNLKLRGDLPRRIFPIRLDAKLAKPWERDNFRHDNLKEWVSQRRGVFLADIHTIARAWFVAGKPEPKKPLPVIGGFEAWAKIIGGILAFAGVDGFLENLKKFHNVADLEGPEWEGFLNAWVEVIGNSAKTCQEVAAILRDNPKFTSTLPDNLQDILEDPDKGFEKSLGRALARKENRPYGEKNLAIQRGNTTRGKVILWKVAPL